MTHLSLNRYLHTKRKTMFNWIISYSQERVLRGSLQVRLTGGSTQPPTPPGMKIKKTGLLDPQAVSSERLAWFKVQCQPGKEHI